MTWFDLRAASLTGGFMLALTLVGYFSNDPLKNDTIIAPFIAAALLFLIGGLAGAALEALKRRWRAR